ncbi:MAG: helix-turn-helix transcriptional regulator [Acidobacteriaceae bacterium]
MDTSPPASALTPAVFAVLLALADGEKHGYGILQESRQHTPMGPGTLYGTLDRLLASGHVEETDRSEFPVPAPGSRAERRRFYRLTGVGHQSLAVETARLDQAVRRARSKGVVPAEANA